MAYFTNDDIHPVTRITAGDIGDPGQRFFVLQAHYGAEAVAWVIHKDQALGLSRAIPRMLADVHTEFPELTVPLVATEPNLTLTEPPYPRFRVGSLGLGYDRIHDLVVLTLVDADTEHGRIEDFSGGAGSGELYIYATRGQALLLSQRMESVVAAGRPFCPRCGEPMDDFGHFCLPPITHRKVDGAYVQ